MCFAFGIVAEEKLSRLQFERAKKKWETKTGKDWEMVDSSEEEIHVFLFVLLIFANLFHIFVLFFVFVKHQKKNEEDHLYVV